jgi:hypothetical protein
LPNPKNASPAPTYTPDLDPGIGTFDSRGNLHTINWRSYIVGAQYYLPPSGKFWIAGNFSHMQSSNAEHYVSNAGKAKIFTKSNWADGNLFWDALPALRLGAEYAYFEQTYADVKEAPGNPAKVKDHRVQFSAFYMF